MAEDRHVYGAVNNKTGMKRVFTGIRRDVAGAKSRPALTELYKRAGYMITLTYAPSWGEKFGREAGSLRRTIVAPLVGLQSSGERWRAAWVSNEERQRVIDSLVLRGVNAVALTPDPEERHRHRRWVLSHRPRQLCATPTVRTRRVG